MHTEKIPAEAVHVESRCEARDMIHAALEACFASPPTAGAVLLVNDEHGTRMFNLNLDAEELVTTLCSSGAKLAADLGYGDNEDRVLQ